MEPNVDFGYPWDLERAPHIDLMTGGRDWVVGVDNDDFVPLAMVFDGGTDVSANHARLIKMAPRMYEALKDIALGQCCETEGCDIAEPLCAVMLARQIMAEVDAADAE